MNRLQLAFVFITVLAISIAGVSPAQVGASNGKGQGLQVSLFANNTTVVSDRSSTIVATVLLNGTPLEGANVAFSCTYHGNLLPSKQRTDVNGTASVVYSPYYGISRFAQIIAQVDYDNMTAYGYLNITIVDPPPNIIHGKDPRDPPALLMVWCSSGVVGIFLALLLPFIARPPMDRRPDGS